MFKILTVAVCLVLSSIVVLPAFGWEWWADLEVQWADLRGERDLSPIILTCSDGCSSDSYDEKSQGNVAILATNKLYGQTQSRVPFSQKGRPWDTIGAYSWKNLGVSLSNGELVRVSVSASRSQLLELANGKTVALKILIRRENGTIVEVTVSVTLGRDNIIEPVKVDDRWMDNLTWAAEASAMNPGTTIATNQRYGYGLGDWFYTSPGDCWGTATGVMCSPY